MNPSVQTPASIREILERNAIEMVFQPIVTLPTGAVVGYEALARGPEGSPLRTPDRLFAAARAEGLLAELDYACQAEALRSALEAGLRRPFMLSVNIEPGVSETMPDELRALLAAACEELDVMIEVTERALTHAPAELLGRVVELRDLGCRIAVDDVGADPRSLAMMAFLQPDVIKLDKRFVQGRPDEHVAAVAHAVNAEAERTGASVLVEGIEQAEQVDAGLALGAALGQGWHFGRPGALPVASSRRLRHHPVSHARQDPMPPTPYQLVEHHLNARVSAKHLLYAMTRHLEREAVRIGDTAVLLSTFEHSEFMTPDTRRRYVEIARRIAFCGALAMELESEPAPGVRGVALEPDNPLAAEWDVAVVSPHFAAALIACDLGDAGSDLERRFRYVLTYDRRLAVAAARSMMARIAARELACLD